MTKVWPVEGYFLATVPAAEHECDGKGDHALCVKSGAFTDKPPKQAKPAPADAGAADSQEA